jgi:hypothetical protein
MSNQHMTRNKYIPKIGCRRWVFYKPPDGTEIFSRFLQAKLGRLRRVTARARIKPGDTGGEDAQLKRE